MYEFTLLQLLLMFAVVSLIGLIIGYMFVNVRGSNRKQDEKIQQLENEIAVLEEHKAQVSHHFQKTASLLHDMTGQYKAIYEHMAEGAQTLCDDHEGAEVLESLQSGLLLGEKENLKKITRTSSETDEQS